MANEQLFTNRAKSYGTGRLGYAYEVIELLCTEILKPHDKIADVGSGTGIFARELIERGFDVFCVEPSDAMRLQAEQLLAGNPHFISVAASAEATTLPANSVNVVTAASAFHWFDVDRFCRECNRILTPDGVLFTVINARDYNDPFTVEQHKICQRLCPTFTSLRHGLDQSVPQFETLFGGHLHHVEFNFPLRYTKEKFIQRSLSSSYAPDPDTKEYEAYQTELRELMNAFAPESDTIMVPNASVVYWGRLLQG